jgi:hypothetical protein
MQEWTVDELARIGRASELRVAGRRPDGELRKLVTIWHVIVDGELYFRSVYGTKGGWYRGTQATGRGRIESGGVAKDVTFTLDSTRDDEVDAAYRRKYGTGSPVQHITSPAAKETTLRADPE